MSRGLPERTCVGCRGKDVKANLVRLVWDPTQRGSRPGQVVVDRPGTAPGRGAYVHLSCVERAGRGVGRTLKRSVDGAQVAALLASLGQT